MQLYRVPVLIACAIALGSCASVHNEPLNKASLDPFAETLTQAAAAAARDGERHGDNDGAVIVLAFSGGGTRAAAFAFGVLQQLQRTPSPAGSRRRDLLDHVAVVSGVSGGSIIAAYYGLRGRAAMSDFRQRFLLKDAMSELQTGVGLVTLSRALGGGVNTDDRMRNWLDANLFHKATFKALIARTRPIVLINATDVYSRTPFVFSPVTFAAACSDITEYPIAEAVAASAAVPGAFAPIVIETFPGQCRAPIPSWVLRAAKNPGDSPLLYSHAQALLRARSGKVKYIKLFDGGLVDNYGLSGLTIARASASTPYGPLRPEEAVNMRRLLLLVVDAGRAPRGKWAQTLQGPSGKQLISAVVDALVDANTRSSYTAFEATMRNWRDKLVRWRCGLKRSQVARLRTRRGRWSCRDLKFDIGRISFEQLDTARAARLNDVPTTFSLPAATVDELTRAGSDALRANPAFHKFVRDM